MFSKKDRQRIRPYQLFQDRLHGLKGRGVPLQGVLENVSDDFRIRVRTQRGRLQLCFQVLIVLYDAVVHQSHRFRQVRMRVGLAGLAVGGPAGMPDAAPPRQRHLLRFLDKRFEFALGSMQMERRPV